MVGYVIALPQGNGSPPPWLHTVAWRGQLEGFLKGLEWGLSVTCLIDCLQHLDTEVPGTSSGSGMLEVMLYFILFRRFQKSHCHSNES